MTDLTSETDDYKTKTECKAVFADARNETAMGNSDECPKLLKNMKRYRSAYKKVKWSTVEGDFDLLHPFLDTCSKHQKEHQKNVKLLQKPTIMLELSSQLLFPVRFGTYRLRVKREVMQKSDKK